MTDLLRVILFSAMWAAFGVVSGWVANRLPASWLDRDSPLTRLRSFEFRGRCYDRRLGVRKWKDRLPEAGAMFSGGVSKSSLPGFGRPQLSSFVRETRRAELVHWANVAFGWTFFAWNEWVVGVFMVLFGAVVHLPFVVVQRYNRARLLYVLDRPAASISR